jgi:hypothetical protein
LNSAAIVIEHGDGTLLDRCVDFDTTSITGEGLLNSSGVAWSGQTFGGFGSAVCAIDAEPAHYSICPGKDSYWAVFVSTGGSAWVLAAAGISSLTMSNGDALGFRYVPAAGTPQPPPSAAGVCPAQSLAVTTARATARATATPAQAGATRRAGSSATATAAGGDRPVAGATAAVGSTPEDRNLVPDGASARAGGTALAAANPAAAIPGSGTGGLDLGLLAACAVGGGLAGLALLRLMAARRRRCAA